jgi:hypothetical protein
VGGAITTNVLLAAALLAQAGPPTDTQPVEQPSAPTPASFVRAAARSRFFQLGLCPSYGGVPGLSLDANGNPYITNIQQFLDTCPQRDPNLQEIRNDFEIRRDEVLITSFPCTEPVSTMPAAQYTDPLIALQVLRAMYYMDRGQGGHLPWTTGTLYQWMKARIQGVDIVTGVSGGYCCTTIAGKTFFVGGSHNDTDREFDKTWEGISNVMAFYAHERRHLDGNGFPHSSCCGIAGGCDDNYDPNNLAPYGVQWWLEKSWLAGDINVGVGCLAQSLITQDGNWHLGAANNQFRDRFCYTKPPVLSKPSAPGGPCNPRSCPCPAITIAPAALPQMVVDTDFRQVLAGSGGTAPYAYALAGGSLPPGLTLSAAGVLAGRPTALGRFTFTVSAQDTRQCSAVRSFTATVASMLHRHARPAH